ncbi:MAG: hypothetical protein HY006_04320 [Candidatus Sungbacteria bacterium]|nr:hypothetical protein [Candidatus Sungbacteria bacterium]
MSKECAYSFDDLFLAAYHRTMSHDEKTTLSEMTQLERNALVCIWAAQAHWHVRDRLGTDGNEYVAFAPFPFV